MHVADDQIANVVKWLVYVAVVVAGLVTAGVILERVSRYSYEKSDTFGLEVRTDRFTGEKCLYAGQVELGSKIGLEPCQ